MKYLKHQEVLDKVNKEQGLEIERQHISILNKDRAIVELRNLLSEGKDKIEKFSNTIHYAEKSSE